MSHSHLKRSSAPLIVVLILLIFLCSAGAFYCGLRYAAGTETPEEAPEQILYYVSESNSYNALDDSTRTTRYQYDGRGKLMRYDVYDNETLVEWGESIYDDAGRCVASRGYDAEGTLLESTDRVYDEGDHLLSEASRYGAYVTRYTYVYDDHDHVTHSECTSVCDDGTSGYSCVCDYAYTYEEDGGYTVRFDSITSYVDSSLDSVHRLETYDKNGNNLRSDVFADDGSLLYSYYYTYSPQTVTPDEIGDSYFTPTTF